jgi:hypothetical protein
VVLSAIAYYALEVTAANSGEARSKAIMAPRGLCVRCQTAGWAVSQDFEVDYLEVLPAYVQDPLPGVDEPGVP